MLCNRCGNNMGANDKVCIRCGNVYNPNNQYSNTNNIFNQNANVKPSTNYNQGNVTPTNYNSMYNQNINAKPSTNYNMNSQYTNQPTNYNGMYNQNTNVKPSTNYNMNSQYTNQPTNYNGMYNQNTNAKPSINYNMNSQYTTQPTNYNGMYNQNTNAKPSINYNMNSQYTNQPTNYNSMYNQNNNINASTNYNSMYNQYNTIPKKSNKTLYTCLGIMVATLVVVVALIVAYNKDDVYFSREDTNGYSGGSSTAVKNETVINTDRTYYMTVNDKQTAYNKIKEDSVSQKNTCSKEIIEIEERIINNYNITAVNLCEMDLDYAKELEQVVKRIYEDFPNARGHLTNLTLTNVPANQGYIAAFQVFHFFITPKNQELPVVTKNSILLNTKYFLNSNYMISSMQDATRRGHFPPNTTRTSAVAHEFGHYLSFVATMKKYNVNSILILDDSNKEKIYALVIDWSKGTHSLDLITTAYKNYQKNYNDYNTSFLDFRASISGYAVAKDEEGNYIYDETIAEAFHDYYLNGNSAKPASKEIVAELNRRLS